MNSVDSTSGANPLFAALSTIGFGEVPLAKHTVFQVITSIEKLGGEFLRTAN
jgi:hypothetical protein